MQQSLPTDLAAASHDALCGRRYPPDLLARLDALDKRQLRADAWIALFQGRRLCRLHSRFADATPLIDDALAQFRAAGDDDGELWALAEWVVMRYHADDFERGLAEIGPALERPMRPYLRAELLFGQFLCLIGSSRVPLAVHSGEAAL